MLATLLGSLLTGCGGSADEPAAVRAYSIDLTTDDSTDDYRYITLDPIDIKVGDEVTFSMTNTGSLPHDLNIIDPSGARIGGANAVAAGGLLTVTILFEEPGVYRLNCNVDDHLTRHSMQEFIQVTEAE